MAGIAPTAASSALMLLYERTIHLNRTLKTWG
jgi:hypothetical protein